MTRVRVAFVALGVSLGLAVVCCGAFTTDTASAGADAGGGGDAAADGGGPDAAAPSDSGGLADAGPLKDCVTHTQDFEASGLSAPWVGRGIERVTDGPHGGVGAGRGVGAAEATSFVQADVEGGYTHVDVDYWLSIKNIKAYAEVGCFTLFYGGTSTLSAFLAFDGSANFVADNAGTTLRTAPVGATPVGYVHATVALDLVGTKLHYRATIGSATFEGSGDVGPFTPDVAGVHCGVTSLNEQGQASVDVDDIKLRLCRR